MSEYNVEFTQQHQLSAGEARSRAETFVESVKKDYNLTWKWEGDTIQFKVDSGVAKGVSGVVRLNEGSVFVGGKLPFGLLLMKGFVEQQLKGTLAKVFA